MHERAGDTQEGSIEVAMARLRWAGIAPKTISQTLEQSYVAPVLTAHPTEVQRKSILDAERDIELQIDPQYVMSPKDLKTIGFFDKMVQSGARIFIMPTLSCT